MEAANRIRHLKPYFFAALRRKIAALNLQGKDVIRMDIGSPDMPPPEFIIDSMIESAHNPNNHGYTAYGGTPAYREAIATYYKNRFGVDLNPGTEIVGLIGSKEGLFTISQTLINPGDIALVPDPGYATYKAGTTIAGGEAYPMPLLAKNNFLPDLSRIPEDILSRAKILWLNYPNNPTGATAPISFFKEVVAFAHQHGLIIAHDAPYTDICFDGYQAPSILEVDGAKDVAVEFNSLSKAYNMAGWRLGMACGNATVVNYVEEYKSQVDTSHFEPILGAGITALTGDQAWLTDRNAIYQKRRDVILEGMAEMDVEPVFPKAALYVWTRLPPGTDDVEYCAKALEEAAVSITPGSIYGKSGKGYFRISICNPEPRMREGISRLSAWMNKAN